MPIFSYFSVIGLVLLGLLYVVEAQLGPPKTMSVSTNFYGIRAAYKAEKPISILTVRDAPAPVITEVAAIQPQTEPPKPQAAKLASQRKPKKPNRVVRQKLNPNLFAESTMAPRTPHSIW